MLHSINNTITHWQLDINTLTRTRTSVLFDTASLNKHCKLVRNFNTDSKTIIGNINNTILICRSEQDNINSIHNLHTLVTDCKSDLNYCNSFQ